MMSLRSRRSRLAIEQLGATQYFVELDSESIQSRATRHDGVPWQTMGEAIPATLRFRGSPRFPPIRAETPEFDQARRTEEGTAGAVPFVIYRPSMSAFDCPPS
jgi:hypothetical protein